MQGPTVSEPPSRGAAAGLAAGQVDRILVRKSVGLFKFTSLSFCFVPFPSWRAFDLIGGRGKESPRVCEGTEQAGASRAENGD